jgi:hypothetical protein
MNIVAAIPVHGRHPLLKYTIKRLLTKCGVSRVVCVGGKEDRSTCEKYGANFIHSTNYPLGAKWNKAFQGAKAFDPDAILFVGSSDWVTDNWCKEMYPLLESSYMVGKLGCHLLDIRQNFYRLVYWPGYKKGTRTHDRRRDDEPIGIGRLLSRDFLKKIQYTPFNNNQDASLDWTMYQKAGNYVGLYHGDAHSMAISTDKWGNKHNFNHHYTGKLPSKRLRPADFCDKYFPEYKLIFND